MIDHVEAPEIYVFSEDRRKTYSVLRNAIEFTEDIRFNTCSEVHLKVADKICDPLTGKWIDNPVYEQLEKNNLLYLCDDNEYFSFPNRTIGDDSFYSIVDPHEISSDYGRDVTNGNVSMTYENDESILSHFRVQPETDLINISVAKGYSYWNLSEITEYGYERRPNDWDTKFYKVCCDNFVPIEAYDVVSLRMRLYMNAQNDGIKYRQYTISFYSEPNANSLLADLIVKGYVTATSNKPDANPVYRFNVNMLKQNDFDTFHGDGTDEEIFTKLKKTFSKQGGYIRISVHDNFYLYSDVSAHVSNNNISEKRKYTSYNYTSGGSKVMGWSFPYDDWVKVYSGKRYCSKIDNEITDGEHGIPMHWFVIVDTEEEYDGNIRFKNIIAYSYEYTISNKKISLSEDTLPFYIPPEITNIVNGDSWIIDKQKNVYGYQAKQAKQYMSEGLLNKVLELLPDWKVGHISSALMTRYRKVDDIDNSNLYSFLMNDIESLYQCYFVFNCDDKTISAYTQEDIVKNSNIVLNWQNALKGMKIKDQDKNFTTALRVHTADDTYGIGLINPTGNSVIYNFNSVLDKMDFVADTSDNDPLNRNKITENGITRNRTLKEAIQSLISFIESPQISVVESICTTIGDGDGSWGDYDVTQHNNIYTNRTFNINSLNGYRSIATKFVECNLDIIKNESALAQQASEYMSVINKIQVQVEYDNQVKKENNSSYIEVNPYTYEKIQTPALLYDVYTSYVGAYKRFGNDSLYAELVNAAKQYYLAKAEYEAKLNDYNSYKDILVKVSSKTNLNYYKQISLTAQYRKNNNAGLDEEGNPITLSLLTPAEILALQPFIREGDWTNDNTIFSEDYDAKDIVSTLVSTFDQAKSDMDTFLSKPSYDFESDVVNWTVLPEMKQNYKKLKVGKTLYINSVGDEYVIPLLLELHINYFDKDDFTMTFTTNYKRKVSELRFYDLYSEVNRISATDSTFTFSE